MASGDSFAARIIIDEWKAASADMRRISDRAVMWALRDTARQAGRAAKKVAPVYRGRPRKVKVDGKRIDVVPGEYKNSIKSSKRLTKTLGGYSLKVGPRGGHVHLYAGKVERKYKPMQTGYDAVKPLAAGIQEAAMARALKKYGK